MTGRAPLQAQGISARIRVPDPGELCTSRRPSSASRRSASPRRPDAAGGIGAADPVVGDDHRRLPVGAADADDRVRGLRVLGDVRHRLRDDVVRGRLDRPGEALVRHLGDLDGHRRAGGQRLDRRAQAAVGQDGGMDPAGQLAQLVEALGELVLRLREQLAGGGRVLAQRRLDQAQVERDGDQPLLRAVVQVALQPPALGVAGLDDARAGGGELLVRLGVGDRLRDQLGEVAEAPLGALGERRGRAGPGGERPPQAAADEDRRRDRAAVAGAPAASRRASRSPGRTPPARECRCAAPAR